MNIQCMECKKDKPEHRHGLCEECIISFYNPIKKKAKDILDGFEGFEEELEGFSAVEKKDVIKLVQIIRYLSKSAINMQNEIENLSTKLIEFVEGQGDLN